MEEQLRTESYEYNGNNNYMSVEDNAYMQQDITITSPDGNLIIQEPEVVESNQLPTQSTYFDYADLVSECSCGNVETIEKLMTGGIQVILQTTDTDVFGLACNKCGHSIKLKFVKSSDEDIANKQLELDKQELEQIIEFEKNESVQQTSEAESMDMGVSNSTEQSIEVNS